MDDDPVIALLANISASVGRMEAEVKNVQANLKRIESDFSEVYDSVSALKTDRDKAIAGFAVLVFVGGMVWTALTFIGGFLK